jgi:hypothetical protein
MRNVKEEDLKNDTDAKKEFKAFLNILLEYRIVIMLLSRT